MDEVEAMTRAGEMVGRAMGTGLHAVRVQAARASRTGGAAAVRAARRAERRLAARGIAPSQLPDVLSESATRATEQAAATGRRARRKLAKRTAGVRADAAKRRAELLRSAKAMRKEAAKQAAEARRRAKRAKRDYALQIGRSRRRRWPWVLGVLAAGIGAVLVALSRRPQEVRLADVSEEPQTVEGAETEQLAPEQRGPAAGETTGRPRHQRRP
ncbi:hypothetical protein [Gandjariella thermophila]|uniref:Uncharacterized protein n=1 Tax=Gandjariella thermophila TaxID=1931992 RepID=A0A4D4JAH4_9PSEU|nr:hypothetical protein [Gandjariella thermophila]GDY30947.1 hypothetical protein GTS_25800 [Gandjariella thermophila]